MSLKHAIVLIILRMNVNTQSRPFQFGLSQMFYKELVAIVQTENKFYPFPVTSIECDATDTIHHVLHNEARISCQLNRSINYMIINICKVVERTTVDPRACRGVYFIQ